MDLRTFFQESSKPSFYQERSVIVFKYKNEYPLLFAYFCAQLFKKNSPYQITFFDLGSSDEQSFKAQLSTTFLGSRSIYWLGNLELLESRKKKSVMSYLCQYMGPHLIIGWSEQFESSNASHEPIELNDKIALQDMYQLARLIGQPEIPLIAQMIKENEAISMDHGCLMMQYASVMSRQMLPEFKSKWMHKLTTPEQSLFTLSSDFFAKNRDAFFEQWALLCEQYGPPFWTAYWSEQLFRAACFVNATHKQQHAQAKKISFKLPFSFIKKDWRSYTAAELSRAHDFIFQIDCSLKQGGEPFSFDLFYLKFFLGEFK